MVLFLQKIASEDSGWKHYKCLKYCQIHISDIFGVFHSPITSTPQWSVTFSSNFFWSEHTVASGHTWHAVLVLSLKYLLRFWTETTFAQTTQSLLPSSTEIAWYCLLSLLASISAAGWPRKHFPPTKWRMIAILNERKSCGFYLTFKIAGTLPAYNRRAFSRLNWSAVWPKSSAGTGVPDQLHPHFAGGQGIGCRAPPSELRWTVVGLPTLSGGWIMQIKCTERRSYQAMATRFSWHLHT